MQVVAPTRSPIERFKRLAKDNGLPPSPRAIGALLALLRSDQCTPCALETLIGTDAALTAALIGFANSGLVRGESAASSLSTAIAKLGRDAIVTLLAEALSSGAFPFSDDPRIHDGWERTAALARIGTRLAARLDIAPPGLAHAFVVLRDCAVTCLLPCISRESSRPDVTQSVDADAELGIGHAGAGALLAASWGLDAVLVAAIRDHHALGAGAVSHESTQQSRTLIAIGVLADEVFARAHHSHSREWAAGREYLERELRLANAQSEQLIERVRRSLECTA